MTSLLLNIDVPDLERGVAFYTAGLGLVVGRRFGQGFVELLGAEVPIYLLQRSAGTPIGPAGADVRRYSRHWSPLHLDFVVTNIASASARAVAAGAVLETQPHPVAYGSIAMLADPFGNGFCLIEFNSAQYDALMSGDTSPVT